MENFKTDPAALVRSFRKNRSLVFSLAAREVAMRYRGTFGGFLWALVQPILMLCIYTFVFSVIFNSRWRQESSSDAEYALVLFIGLFVFQIFSECINRAPNLIIGNVNYVKKVLFPLEILPIVVVYASLFQLVISLGVWLVAYIYFIGIPPATGMLFPIVLIPLLFLSLGVSWILTSLGVYIRDISQIITIMTTILFFMSPIFYPITAVPERFHIFYNLNPVTYAVETSRDVLFFGKIPSLSVWIVWLTISMLFAWIGYFWFQKTRKGFADVL